MCGSFGFGNVGGVWYGTILYVVPTTAKKIAASFGSGSCGRTGEDALHIGRP